MPYDLPEIVKQLGNITQFQAENVSNKEAVLRFFYWLMRELLKIHHQDHYFTRDFWIGIRNNELCYSQDNNRYKPFSFGDFKVSFWNIIQSLEEKIVSLANEIFGMVMAEREILLRVLKASEVFGEIRVAFQTNQFEKKIDLANSDLKILF